MLVTGNYFVLYSTAYSINYCLLTRWVLALSEKNFYASCNALISLPFEEMKFKVAQLSASPHVISLQIKL